MEDSQEKKRDLKILEKTRELTQICKDCVKEFNESSMTEEEAWMTEEEALMTDGAARRFWRKIQEALNEVTKIKRELEELQNAPLG
jgi:uncharacterized protein (UPF0332 family)